MIRSRLKLSFFTLFILFNISFGIHHKHFHRVPIIDLNGAEELIGTIREDEQFITVTPNLHILKGTGPVCRYEITPIGSGKETLFESVILDNDLGSAKIQLRNGAKIDCSDVQFSMHLSAVRCGDESVKSEPVTLKVIVQDSNDHAPEFESPWYTYEIEEGKITEITRLYATDKDCGHPYGKICRYEITNTLPGSPFSIDDQGILSTVKPLNRSEAESHILTVVAEDCGMLRSKSTLVTVKVKQRCIDGIRFSTGKNPTQVFVQGEYPKRILPNAEVFACNNNGADSVCKVDSAEIEVKLHTERSRNFSPEKLNECGLSPDTVALLPKSVMNRTSISIEGEKDDEDEFDSESQEDGSSPSTDGSQLFDGKTTAMIVPPETISKVIPERFTFHFSMKNAPGSEKQQREKQNILCESDLSDINRHHFAVYLRHCKLELLLRREFEGAESDFRAAEWRWFDERICDEKWHSYTILFSDLDNVQLSIDGELFNATERNPEILDDWPLHKRKEKQTRLVVGACWHARSQSMVQFYKGHLSSLYLLASKVEEFLAIGCLHKNHERLQFNAVGELISGEGVSFNKDRTEVRLKANTLEDLSLLLQKVQYSVDPIRSQEDEVRTAPAIQSATRVFTVTGHYTCSSPASAPSLTFPLSTKNKHDNSPPSPKAIKTTTTVRQLAPLKSVLEVKPSRPEILAIVISGQNIINADRKSLKVGTPLLPELEIIVADENNPFADMSHRKLEWCKVHLKPPRDMDLEYFSSPATLIASMNVDFVHDKEGMMLKGRETGKNYAQILSNIHYFNTRPESYPRRMYTVQCSMPTNVISNNFTVTMSIDITSDITDAINKLSNSAHRLESYSPVSESIAGSSVAASSTEIDDENKNNNNNQDNKNSLFLSQNPMAKHFEPEFDQMSANRLQNILEMDLPRPKALIGGNPYETGSSAIAGGAVALVVVFVIGILLVLLIVGVVKMRDDPVLRRNSRRDSMLEWDDNGLNMNLTMNPLDDIEAGSMIGKRQQQTMQFVGSEAEGDESGSDDGDESGREDELTDDDYDGEEIEGGSNSLGASNVGEKERQGLEWDDSTLASAAATKSYRV